MQNRKYIIFDASEIDKLNTEELVPGGLLSVDQTKAIVKWKGEQTPSSINNLTTLQGPYTHSEIRAIINTSEWNSEL